MIKKLRLLKYSFFKNVLLFSISRNSLQTKCLDDILIYGIIPLRIISKICDCAFSKITF